MTTNRSQPAGRPTATRSLPAGIAAALVLALGGCGGGGRGPDAGRVALAAPQAQPQTYPGDAADTRVPQGVGADAAAAVTHHLVHDGATRRYTVLKPASCTADCPVMMDLHGYTSSGAVQRLVSGMDILGEAQGVITVYPDGRFRSWNAGAGRYGACCGQALEDDVDDVGFVRAMVAKLRLDHPTMDVRRVYATGISNGCAMAQRLAAEAPDVVAAVACSALYLLTGQDSLSRPVSVTEIHGIDDTVVSYAASADWTGARGNFERWARLDRCTGEPVRTPLTPTSFKEEYRQCAEGTRVTLYSIAGGHATYRNPDRLDIAGITWDAVRVHRLP